ncbi:MAG: hypothetical protein HDP34_03400 [Clostridia bacterium]|nr:hypothetical protein [Clostridia bacterium]
MIKAYRCAALSSALEKLKKLVQDGEKLGKKTVVFCEDRLSLAAERTICAAVGGTFLTSVYTFARFLAAEKGNSGNVLSAQGSAMAVRMIIEEQKDKLQLFKKLSSSSAAQAVYDTIALLYSSRVSAEDVEKASVSGSILGGKLHDLAIIYSEYEKFLKSSGKQDRNGYLKQLGPVIESSPKIRGSRVIFLGFQAFTCTVTECVRAAFSSAESVFGLFTGGEEDIYVNEAFLSFTGAAAEFGGAETSFVEGGLLPEAEELRRGLFNPESFYKSAMPTDKVHVFEAADEEEELEFIAASIKKHVIDGGERYAKISVMLPDLDGGERALARVFKRFAIPYYADRQLPLAEHPLCAFIINYLLCALSGCNFSDVDAVIASPFFPAERGEKDIYRNYLLRLGNYRGGVRREPKKEISEEFGFDYETVTALRKTFLNGLDLITSKGVKSGICGGVRALLEGFDVQNKLKSLAESYKDERPTSAQFSARAYDAVLSVLSEAESLLNDTTTLKEFVKILKSGFAAMKISLIPPKSDAVFVGDLSATANTGTNVVFAARLTGDVPGASADCALLTDREISALEDVNLNISPKIRQVNARRSETIALNICAFRKQLYLTYPTRLGGEESGASEIISYASAIFSAPSGAALKAVDMKRIEKSGRAVPYYCSEKLPALKYLQKYASGDGASAVYEVLSKNGFKTEADGALKKRVRRDISCGQRLYLSYNGISPTALETYFSCPYLSFMRQGLKVKEREEGAVRAVDNGNFIHSVLQDLAPEVNGISDEPTLLNRAREIAEDKLKKPPYSSLADSKSGSFAAEALIGEAVKISLGMYSQIKNSSFEVSEAECKCEVNLGGGVKIFGRIDRVDKSGDMVRIIDYKTGAIDASAAKYYTGAKLQLPLYLLSVSEGKRAVGAYYFPAAIEYKEKQDGVFRLQGFMDGSDEVVSASDKSVQPKQKSEFVDAYLSGRKIDGAMPREDFAAFLEYSRLVADKGAQELISGNVTPSPAKGTCDYCKAGGSCNFAVGIDGAERKTTSVKCSDIAALVKNIKGGGDVE